jgi:putative DNA primase/helicase
VRGCLDWLANGLCEPHLVRQATVAYQAEQDSVRGFIEDRCFVHRDARIRASLLHEAYLEWSGDRLMRPQAFGDRLRDLGYSSRRGHGGGYFWHGIGLTAEEVG